MNQTVLGMAYSTESMGGSEFKGAKASAWNDVLRALVDPASGMDEEDRKNYEQKIMQKMKMGKRLTAEELNYLRVNNPELYRSAMRVDNARKALQLRLENCKSKEEVNQVISGQMETLKAMKDDPDIEYITAMVKEVIGKFKRSREYARLPVKQEEEKKKIKEPSSDLWEDEKTGYDEYNKVIVYSRMQIQCNMIVRMAQAFVS